MSDGVSDPLDQIEIVITGPRRAAGSSLWQPIGPAAPRAAGAGPVARQETPSAAAIRGRGVNVAA